MTSKIARATAEFWGPQYGSRPGALMRGIDLLSTGSISALLGFKAIHGPLLAAMSKRDSSLVTSECVRSGIGRLKRIATWTVTGSHSPWHARAAMADSRGSCESLIGTKWCPNLQLLLRSQAEMQESWPQTPASVGRWDPSQVPFH